MITTTPLMQMLQGYLKVTSERQQLIASNIANVDTPGYRTKDVDFQSAMKMAVACRPLWCFLRWAFIR